MRVYEKLGIPIEEQKVLAGVEGARKVAVDAVFDSVSVATTFREELKAAGVIFMSISEAIASIPSWSANISAASSHSATIISLPQQRGVQRRHVRAGAGRRTLPDGAQHLFRINAENTGQFERTLIVAEKGAYVSYLEGCTAPMRDENQLTPRSSKSTRMRMPR